MKRVAIVASLLWLPVQAHAEDLQAKYEKFLASWNSVSGMLTTPRSSGADLCSFKVEYRQSGATPEATFLDFTKFKSNVIVANIDSYVYPNVKAGEYFVKLNWDHAEHGKGVFSCSKNCLFGKVKVGAKSKAVELYDAAQALGVACRERKHEERGQQGNAPVVIFTADLTGTDSPAAGDFEGAVICVSPSNTSNTAFQEQLPEAFKYSVSFTTEKDVKAAYDSGSCDAMLMAGDEAQEFLSRSESSEFIELNF